MASKAQSMGKRKFSANNLKKDFKEKSTPNQKASIKA